MNKRATQLGKLRVLIHLRASVPCTLRVSRQVDDRELVQKLTAVLDCCLPSDCVVVDIDLAQAAHHVQLVAGTGLAVVSITASNGLQAIDGKSTTEP